MSDTPWRKDPAVTEAREQVVALGRKLAKAWGQREGQQEIDCATEAADALIAAVLAYAARGCV